MNDLRERIINASITVFNKKGIKFTMDEVASELSISKKTIYKVFKTKNELIDEIVDYCFDSIKEAENEIVNDDSLTLMEKIQAVMSALPQEYERVNLNKLYNLKEKYPQTYKKVETRLETEWESTIELLIEAKEQGLIKDLNIPLFKLMFEATLEKFFKIDFLDTYHMTYNEALKEVANILVNGIKKG